MLLSISLHASKFVYFSGVHRAIYRVQIFQFVQKLSIFTSYPPHGCVHCLFTMETNLLLQKNAIIILRKMITIEKRHFRSKQDFHLELSPIGNLKSFMSGPPVAKKTLVLISTIHPRVAQLGLTISTIHRRVAHKELSILKNSRQKPTLTSDIIFSISLLNYLHCKQKSLLLICSFC